MQHYRQPYVETPQCQEEVFECLQQLRCEDGVDPEDLATVLLSYFENMDPAKALALTQLWLRRRQAVLEAFGIW